jgi:hypothetical protein
MNEKAEHLPFAPESSEILRLWKSSEPIEKINDLPHPGPLPLGEGESISAFDEADVSAVQRLDGRLPLPAGEGWGEGEAWANSTCVNRTSQPNPNN